MKSIGKSIIEISQVNRELVKTNNPPPQSNLMSKLKQVKIQEPSDFTKNIDVYLNGEKILIVGRVTLR